MKINILSLVTASVALLTTVSAGAASAEFGLPHLNAVNVGDTFTFAIAGFNNAGTTGYILGSGEAATFGTAQTYTAAGYNGQDYTITSSETVNGATTTDTFTVSTPTSFLTTANVSGTKITQLQFDLGDANSGVGVATGASTVDYALPVTGNSQTGNMIYGTANSSFTLAPSVTLTNGNQSLAAVEGVSYGTTAISNLAIHSFTISVMYNTVPTAVPEPSTLALGGLGLLGGVASLVRRRRLV